MLFICYGRDKKENAVHLHAVHERNADLLSRHAKVRGTSAAKNPVPNWNRLECCAILDVPESREMTRNLRRSYSDAYATQ